MQPGWDNSNPRNIPCHTGMRTAHTVAGYNGMSQRGLQRHPWSPVEQHAPSVFAVARHNQLNEIKLAQAYQAQAQRERAAAERRSHQPLLGLLHGSHGGPALDAEELRRIPHDDIFRESFERAHRTQALGWPDVSLDRELERRLHTDKPLSARLTSRERVGEPCKVGPFKSDRSRGHSRGGALYIVQ